MTLAVRHSHWSDARRLAPRLRREDLEEIQAASGADAVRALSEGYARSATCWTGYVEETGLPCAMFGVVPGPHPGEGHPWLLGSDEITTQPRDFVRLSRVYLPHLEAGWTHLWNWIDERNAVHVRWIRRLGFKTNGRDPHYGVAGLPFLLFEKRLGDLPCVTR